MTRDPKAPTRTQRPIDLKGICVLHKIIRADGRKNLPPRWTTNCTALQGSGQAMTNPAAPGTITFLVCHQFRHATPQHTMTESPVSEVQERKAAIRQQAHENRRNQADKDAVSVAIMKRFLELPEYQTANTVMFYVDVRDEVRTRQALPDALATGKRIVVPYCVDGELELFWLESMDELELGMYRILEPKKELREVAAKHLQPADLDLIMVPGVAFDRTGGRTGHGKGYYDKLLEHASLQTPLVALAFECQMFDAIPMDQHDIYMDKIITEQAVYEGRGRK